VATWIESSDSKALARLPGIGPRAAELLIASLKGKLKEFAIPESVEAGTAVGCLSETQRDALEVLVAWGDSRDDAQRWIFRAEQLHSDLDAPDDWVRAAYRVKAGVEG
jgi:Holliday junction resolvasome RuvABC DNA-binding subunit